ncbi:PTS sugar transporter subunit IIA [Alkalibacterium sp. 20]|uniref:PTS sugar transporter subunit IIA n=1 Tax=Alkalibacterium sp. 20 TaxID=1798803 RepID=UPI0009003FFC|nr:PTS sugar transporter subunit IIA [Alkalibacterium sp. 20]OJF96211.1 PTS galactitol transporter subunit IIA [Alkalibacterium sp. 20]
MKLKLDKNLVFIDLDFEKKEDILNFLSNKLLEHDYVKPEYPKAIIEREKIYPTGLPSLGVNIAIPHADNELVHKTSIAIGMLKNSAKFCSMENIEKELDVKIVMMLAIKEAHGQIEMLQKVVSIIQNDTLTREITKMTDKNKVLTMLEPYLN